MTTASRHDPDQAPPRPHEQAAPAPAITPQAPSPLGSGVSRRSFMQTLGVSAAASSVSARLNASMAPDARVTAGQAHSAVDVVGPAAVNFTLSINGKDTPVTAEPATTLLELLRYHLHLTGTKEICDRGSCGGCSVLLDGKLVASCMMLAFDARGSAILTVEGLAPDGELHPIQEAFIRHDALQCGYCTPGLVIASKALLDANPKPTLDDIKRGLSGNICRCGTYSNVFNAVLDASGQQPIVDPEAR